MSVHITSAVWRESQADGSGLLILLSLADQADDEGRCWPSVASIARRCRRSERAVQDQLAALVGTHDQATGEAHGMFELQREVRPGRSTVYRVLFGWEGAEQARKEARAGGARSAPPEPVGVVETGGAESAPPQNLHPAESAPRIVKETSPNRQGAQLRAQRLPEAWRPPTDVVAEMRQECPRVDQELELRKFHDHYGSLGGQRACRTDWARAYRNWIRNSQPPRPDSEPQPSSRPGYRQTDEQIRRERLDKAGDLIPPRDLTPAQEQAWLRAARQRIAEGLPLEDIGDAA